MSFIEVNNVCKDFDVFKRQKGFLNNIKSLISRKYETVHAVSSMSFSIEPGELIGYIGANGAGKSTTIKMLSGILVPTSGDIRVDGIVPYEDRKRNAMNIGVVFGQRSQLNWDLPTEDTFELYKRMYRIDDAAYRRNVDMFVELMEMQDFIRKPVRQLSLGQKMRAEIAVALLHDPKILYLDEPTIGLDVFVKSKIRTFIRDINKEKNTTVILTTHDMEDISQICDRIIIIDKGRKLVDEPLQTFKRKFSDDYFLEVEFERLEIKDQNAASLPEIFDPRLTIIKKAGARVTFGFNRNEMAVKEAMTYFATQFDISDISMRTANLDEIIRSLYK